MSRPLRILISTYRGNPTCGGQGVYVRYISQALQARGHKVTVLSGQPWPELVDGVELVKLPTLNLSEAKSKILGFKPSWLTSSILAWEWIDSLFGGFPDIWAFGKHMERWLQPRLGDYDVVFDNQVLSYSSLRIQQWLPLVTMIHHPITKDLQIALDHTPGFWDRWLLKRWYSFLSMQSKVASQLINVITPTNNAKRDVSEDFGLPLTSMQEIHLGVDAALYRPIVQIRRQPNRLISTVSADAPIKGVIYLLRALSQVRKIIPDAHLTLLGRPKAEGEIMKEIRTNQLEKSITICSEVSDSRLVEMYAESSLAIVPSIYEGFGLPAIEAMACGVPLIATDGGALPEVLGDAGRIVPSKDSSALAEAIVEVLQDEGMRISMNLAGRKRIAEHFTWERSARETEEVLLQGIDRFDAEQAQTRANTRKPSKG